MILRIEEENRDRLRSAVGVGLLHALIGYVLLTGLGYGPPALIHEGLKIFTVDEEPPPPPAEPARPDVEKKTRKAKPKDAEGAASPANLRNTPTEIVSPKPEIPIPVPPPIPSAPAAGQGSAMAAGAAPVPGPGTGRGGVGSGLGSGRFGNGTGGGGGGGRGSRARWLSGSIDGSDYPDSAYRARVGGTVHLRFTVAPSGRVSDCAVTRSSGSRELDAVTCRLIVRRFRYRPARNAEGVPIASTVVGEHVWEVAPQPPDRWVEPDVEEVVEER
ncbi:MAG TPA: energy transducer TonB [Allosphingosinicella sp.]|jgi:protein TonB|nr:energy transducer TonB [Allosphingosinicella sp.]